ncbi:TetR family transcriptional regulator, partial [Mycolicibacterium diernhoferi]
RRWAAVLNGDPALDSLIESRADLTELIGRYTDLLLGAGHGPAGRVIISMVTKGIQGAVTDKAVQDVSDDDLHQTLLAAVQQLLRTASFFE